MKGKLAVVFFVLLYGGVMVGGMARLTHAAAGELTLTENRLLAHIVSHPFPDGSYIVVMRDTLPAAHWYAGSDSTGAKQRLAAWLGDYTEDAPALAARLIQVNARPARIAFASSRKNGYVVDEDGHYAAYFKGPHGYLGWSSLRAAHPKARASIAFSRPAHDKASGLFLVYLTSGDSGGGLGIFVLYRDRNNTFERVAWRSLIN